MFTFKKKPIKIGKLIKVLPGGRHAIFESSVGPVRKEYPLKKK